MTTDTAHQYWNTEWADLDKDSKWLTPEEDVIAWAATLKAQSKILDLGAGVGRHALWLAKEGFAVTALDAAPDGLKAIEEANMGVATQLGSMSALPFEDDSFDHVLSWNVIYHGDEEVLKQTVSEIARILKPGGTYIGTMLSKRRLPSEQAKAEGKEISRNTWVFDDGGKGDKRHPHYFCNAPELLDLFDGFEVMRLEDREHDTPGSWHWHLIMERLK
jgi:SAM-dependent methyltransferase